MSSVDAIVDLAVFDTLTAKVTLAPVYQDVPEGTQAPVVIVAELVGEPMGGKGSRAMRYDLTVTTEVWEESRKPILELQAEVKAALDGGAITAEGYTIQPVFLDSEARAVAAGQYFGTSNFALFVSPA